MSNSIVIKEPKPAIEEKSATQKQSADISALVKTQNDIIAQNNKMMTALVEASKANTTQQEKNSKIKDLQRQLSEARLQKRIEDLNNRTKKSEEEKTTNRSTYGKASDGVDSVMGKGFTSSMLMSALTMGAINPVVARALNLPQLAGGTIKAGTNVIKKAINFLSPDSKKSSGTTSSNDEATKDSKILKKIDTIINLLGKDSEGGSTEPKTKKGIFSKIFEILGAGLGLFGNTLKGLIKTGLIVAGAAFVYKLIKDKLKSIAEWIFGEKAIQELETKFENEGLWGTIKLGSKAIFKALGRLIFGKKGVESITKAFEKEGLWGAVKTSTKLIAASIGSLIFGESWAEIQEVKNEKGFWEAFKFAAEKLCRNVTDFLFGKETFDEIKSTFDTKGLWGVIETYSRLAIDKLGGFVFGDEEWTKYKKQIKTDGFWNTLASETGGAIDKIGVFLLGQNQWDKVKTNYENNAFDTIVKCVGKIADGIGTFLVGEANWNEFKTSLKNTIARIDEFFSKYVNGFLDRIDNAVKIYNASIEINGDGVLNQVNALNNARKAISQGLSIEQFYDEELKNSGFYDKQKEYLQYNASEKTKNKAKQLVDLYHTDRKKFQEVFKWMMYEHKAVPGSGTILEKPAGIISDWVSRTFLDGNERYANLAEVRYIMASALSTIENEKSTQTTVPMETYSPSKAMENLYPSNTTQLDLNEGLYNLTATLKEANRLQIEANENAKQQPKSIMFNNSQTNITNNTAADTSRGM